MIIALPRSCWSSGESSHTVKQEKKYERNLKNLDFEHNKSIKVGKGATRRLFTFSSNTCQQRALEPTAMLICTLKIQICRRTESISFLQHSSPWRPYKLKTNIIPKPSEIILKFLIINSLNIQYLILTLHPSKTLPWHNTSYVPTK